MDSMQTHSASFGGITHGGVEPGSPKTGLSGLKRSMSFLKKQEEEKEKKGPSAKEALARRRERVMRQVKRSDTRESLESVRSESRRSSDAAAVASNAPAPAEKGSTPRGDGTPRTNVSQHGVRGWLESEWMQVKERISQMEVKVDMLVEAEARRLDMQGWATAAKHIPSRRRSASSGHVSERNGRTEAGAGETTQVDHRSAPEAGQAVQDDECTAKGTDLPCRMSTTNAGSFRFDFLRLAELQNPVRPEIAMLSESIELDRTHHPADKDALPCEDHHGDADLTQQRMPTDEPIMPPSTGSDHSAEPMPQAEFYSSNHSVKSKGSKGPSGRGRRPSESSIRSAYLSVKSVQSMSSTDLDLANTRAKLRQSGARHPVVTAVWQFLEEPTSSRWARLYGQIVTVLILVSVLLTLSHLQVRRMRIGFSRVAVDTLSVLDFFFDFAFTIEVLVRFIACPKRCAFFINLFNLIDVGAALPPLVLRLILGLFIPEPVEYQQDGVAVLVLLCGVPVLRMLKLVRRFEKFLLLEEAFIIALEAMPVLLFTLFLLILTFSTLLHIFEPLDNLPTISAALWLSITTCFTIGYGDLVAASTEGKIVSSGLIVCSYFYLCLPLGIVGNAFSMVWADRDRLLLVKRTREQLELCGFGARDIPELFHMFDMNKNGILSVDEFRDMMQEMNLCLDSNRVVTLFNLIDKDGSGGIDDEELVQALFPKEHLRIYHADSEK